MGKPADEILPVEEGLNKRTGMEEGVKKTGVEKAPVTQTEAAEEATSN